MLHVSCLFILSILLLAAVTAEAFHPQAFS